MPPRLRTCLALAVLTAGAAFWLWRSARNLSQTLADIAAARRMQSTFEQQAGHLAQARSQGAAATPAPGAPASESAALAKLDSRIAAILRDPKLQAAYLAAKKGEWNRNLAPIFRQLNLAPIQIEKLTALLAQRDEQHLDIAASVPGAVRGINSAGRQWFTTAFDLNVNGRSQDPDIQAAGLLLQQSDQSLQAAASDLLGPDNWQQVHDYWRTLPMRPAVESVASSLATTSSPLTSDQLDQLTQIMAQSSVPYIQGKSADIGQVDWNQVMQQAKGVLTPAQLAAFKANLDISRVSAQFMDLVRTAAAASPAGP